MQRDEHGIIIQEGDPADVSGGDSAFSTGMMALTLNMLDIHIAPEFIVTDAKGQYRVVRHPYQARWNKPELTSRDQVVAYFASTRYIRTPEMAMAAREYARSGRVNADILLPHVRAYLYMAAGDPVPRLLSALAKITLNLSIMWDAYVKPEHEMNQSVCICAAFGDEYLKKLYKLHPDLIGNIRSYYSGWRNKHEIGERLINFIKERVK